MSTLHESVERQRASLYNMLLDPMGRVAGEASCVWYDKESLEETLLTSLTTLPYVKYLYALTPDGRQISNNAAREGLIADDFGRDRSQRPYMRGLSEERDMTLSEAYISLRAKRPSLTAIRRVVRNDELIGYLGADVDLRDLPLTREMYEEPTLWKQVKGDPAIRGQLFTQRRAESQLDRHIDDILPVMEELMTESGVYHGKIHFSSSRATIWHLDDPYRYRILDFEALVDPDICLAYPHRPYPQNAKVPAARIRPILDTFRHLRFADDTIYLRAGSVNIFNGIVGLNFSCDGSHYVPFEEFLARDSTFWEGIT
ncbi:MAG: PDC sensor domain-containing protein [Pseudomonadota bacterium]